MNKNSLVAELKKHPWIIVVVLIAHVALAILLSVNLAHDDKPSMPAAKKHNIIDAVAVDAKAYDERKKQKELEEKRKRDQKVAAEKRKQAELKKERERKKAEQKRKQAELKKQQEAKKQAEIKQAEKKKQEALKKEQERKLALAKQKEAEQKEKARKEKQRAEKERLAKLEAERLEKKRLEKERLEKERLEAERRRKEEEKRRAEEKAEFERELLAEERMREETARKAEHAAKLDSMRIEYINNIAARVESSWIKPVGTNPGQSCNVKVVQTMSGDVIDVAIQSCNGNKAFQKSVERAVRRASPLPLPGDPELFEREIIFNFKPRS